MSVSEYYDAAKPDPDEEPPHHVLHVAPPLGDVVASLGNVVARLIAVVTDYDRRIQHLEHLLHRHLNRTEGEL